MHHLEELQQQKSLNNNNNPSEPIIQVFQSSSSGKFRLPMEYLEWIE